MIYISDCNNKTCPVTHSFKGRNRSLQFLKFSCARPCLLSQRTTGGSVAGPAMTWFNLCLPAYILIGNKKCFLPTDNLFITSSHVDRLVHF